MDKKKQIIDLTEGLMDEIVSIRRHLHQHPELSFEENATSEYIRSLLDSWGIAYDYPFVKHGLLARIDGEIPGGKVLAIRSDMDALPISEESGLEFSSVNEGVMHACGHDIHMSSLLGAIKVLNELKPSLKGSLLFIFQPGEEKLPGGAKLMMEEGIFDKIKPDMIIAQHVLPDMEVGYTGFRAGPYMASSDELYLTVHGKGGHGALPENINDPVLMAAQMLIALQQEVNRKSPKGIPTVLSFGKVIADGAVNVIPDKVILEGTFRTMNEKWRKQAHDLIIQISNGIAASMGGKVDLEVRHGYPELVNDPELTKKSHMLAKEFLGEDKVVEMDLRMTAEDFAWFAASYPSMLYRLGVKAPDSEKITPLHTSSFTADESALKTGISMLSWLAFHLAAS
jgi:amidohydrolase